MDNELAKPTVLIVDDDQENIKLVAMMLKEKYTPIGATNGLKALEIAMSDKRPDLILLDVIMPNMDGYEVCKRLKGNEKTRGIPVIFITAMRETEDETKGFEAGAVDYISKPVNFEVLRARVRTHLELKQHHDHLEDLAEQRAKQLLHAERLATIGTLSSGIAHEISSYLIHISDNTEIIRTQIEDISLPMTVWAEEKPDDRQKCTVFFSGAEKSLSAISEGVRRINLIIESMKRFSRGDYEERFLFHIGECIENALDLCHNSLKRHVIIQKESEEELPQFFGNARQLEQVFINLFKNAAEVMDPIGKGTLEISTKPIPYGIQILVEDTGPGIPEDMFTKIWEPFFTTRPNGAGLGLSISKGIIDDHRGRIWAENRNSRGARFIIELPINQ